MGDSRVLVDPVGAPGDHNVWNFAFKNVCLLLGIIIGEN